MNLRQNSSANLFVCSNCGSAAIGSAKSLRQIDSSSTTEALLPLKTAKRHEAGSEIQSRYEPQSYKQKNEQNRTWIWKKNWVFMFDLRSGRSPFVHLFTSFFVWSGTERPVISLWSEARGKGKYATGPAYCFVPTVIMEGYVTWAHSLNNRSPSA